jgi:mono/diheme cytochrome c family protein
MPVLNRFNIFKLFSVLFIFTIVAILLTACGSQPTPTQSATPLVGAVSFTKDVMPILKDRCVNCHGGEKTSKGLNLTTYDKLMAGSNNGPVVTVGNPDNSKILQLILQGKMPKKGGKLPQAQVEILRDWIKAGALDN